MRLITWRCIIILFLNNILVNQVSAQTSTEVLSFTGASSTKSKVTYQNAKQNKNEVETVFSGLFLFYKTFISSQDAVSCVFTPTCSEYALIAIKKQGLVKGFMNTFDRLTRCNGLSPEQYEHSKTTFQMIDSVTVNRR